MAKGRVSIRDVAKESGVSLTTVSLVLNKNDARISEPTRERVLDAIERLHYTPSRLARGLPNRQSKTLAILVPALQGAFADMYFGEVISGIYEVAAERGYRLMLEVARRDYVRRREYMTVLDDCSVDGLLFIGATEEHKWLSEFHESGLPLLVVNNSFEQWDLHHVLCDYAEAGKLAAEYLHAKGHRRIGHIAGPADKVHTAGELTESFLRRLEELGVQIPEQLIVEGKYLVELGKRACDELLERDPDVTAIFAGNDKMALGAYQSIRAAGLEPGSDISVMGCDDIATASLSSPPLTTIRMNFTSVGAAACTRLVDLIESRSKRARSGEDAETNGPVISQRLSVELVERESVKTL